MKYFDIAMGFLGVVNGCWLKTARYNADGSLAVMVRGNDPEYGFECPMATITTCLVDKNLADNESYLDTNNCPWAVDFVTENKLGVVTKKRGYSGFCAYPMVVWDMEKLKEVIL